MTSEHCGGEIPLTAAILPATRAGPALQRTRRPAALPTFATTTSKAPSISPSRASVASTRWSIPFSVALRRLASMASALMASATTRHAPSLSAQSPSTPLPQPTSDSLPAPDPLQHHLDKQTGREMLAIPEALQAELDQPRQVCAVVLGPRKTHAQPPAERDREGVAHPRFQARAAVGSSHRRLALGAKNHDDTLSLPLVIHVRQHQPTGIAGRDDPHQAHAKLAKTGTHARHLILAGRDHDHHNRLPQHRSAATDEMRRYVRAAIPSLTDASMTCPQRRPKSMALRSTARRNDPFGSATCQSSVP